MNANEAHKKAALLHALRELSKNPAWVDEIAPKIREAHQQSLLGLSDRTKTAEQRSEYLEAYHVSRDLDALVPDKIEVLERELNEWMQKEDVVASNTLDLLM